MEELNYTLLVRWFVGLNMDDPVWHPTTFTKNRDRLLSGDVAAGVTRMMAMKTARSSCSSATC